MSQLESQINRNDEAFLANLKAMEGRIDNLEKWRQRSLYEGSEKYIQKHCDLGKNLARKRISMLLDPGEESLELMPFAGWGQDDVALGASLVVTLGVVSRRPCIICANVPTIKGGALNLTSVNKMKRVDEISRRLNLPVIYLVESAGADLPHQAQVFNAGGGVFRGISQRGKMGIPSISVVFGSSTAGGAYIPGMSDYIVMVKKTARMFLAGPPLVKMAIDEDTEEERLGGAETHSNMSGVSDYLADDEEHALEITREIVSWFPSQEKLSFKLEEGSLRAPKFDLQDVMGIIPEQETQPYPVREVIARIADGSEFSEFKASYGKTLVTGFAHIHGHEVGIIANEGVLWPESALKGAHFIQMCNQRKIPLLFLQNITGFMVGERVEHQGIIKEGAKMINAVSNSTVPAITLMIGASFGAGNYAMCGRAYEPDFLFSWPNSRLAVMGPQQMSGVLERIQRDKAESIGKPVDEEQLQTQKAGIEKMVSDQSDPYFVSGQLWDDGIIDPRDTRKVLGLCYSLIEASNWREDSKNKYAPFRM